MGPTKLYVSNSTAGWIVNSQEVLGENIAWRAGKGLSSFDILRGDANEGGLMGLRFDLKAANWIAHILDERAPIPRL